MQSLASGAAAGSTGAMTCCPCRCCSTHCSHQLEAMLLADTGVAADPEVRHAVEDTLETLVVCESCNKVRCGTGNGSLACSDCRATEAAAASMGAQPDPPRQVQEI